MNKADIIAEELNMVDNNIGTRTLATILLKKYPGLFISYDAARAMIGKVRGEFSKKDKIYFEGKYHTTTAQRRANMRKEFKTEYKEIQPYILKAKKVLVLSDIHFPYHDMQALDIAIEYGVKQGCETVYLNGDTLDLYQVSRFTKDPSLMSIPDELAMGRDFLEYLITMFDNVIMKLGNHEKRLEDYMKMKAPELYGMTEFKLDSLLKLKDIGVDYVADVRPSYFGSLIVLHGHEFGHSVFSPVNPARGLYMRSKTSSLIGHHHQTSEHSEKDAKGKVVTTWSTGCLCGLQPEYYPFNKWNHGFAMVEINGQEFEVTNKRISDGKLR